MNDLDWLARISLGVAILSSLVIGIDILVLNRRQKMKIMNWVWPITALYSGPLGLWAYFKLGRGMSTHDHERAHPQKNKSEWKSVFLSTTHCGSGCALADLISEWCIFWIGITIAGSRLYASFTIDFIAALMIGVLFQYAAIQSMKHLAPGEALTKAIKADFLSLTAFQIGMYLWMALTHHIFGESLKPDQSVYWFMMQIGMILGFFTSYPVNVWLVRRGVKEAM